MKERMCSLLAFWNKTKCLFKHVAVLIKSIYKQETPTTDYIDLAPINDATDCEEHIKALQWALANPRVKNIALTGPYGSGKSSIIQTFLERNPLINDKSIKISLATFSDKEGLASLDLEEGILKQLFYKVKQRDIPQSRYRKIHRVSYSRIFAITTIAALFVGVVSFVFWPTILESGYSSVVEAGNKINVLPWLSILLFAILLI